MSLLDSLLEMADENETILRAVFPYPGGKSRSVGNILPLLPYRNKYIEPFGGSAAVLLARRKSRLEIFNDRYAGVVAFYRCIRDAKKMAALCEWLDLTVCAREEFVWAKERWQNVSGDVERAALWYYITNYSFASLGRNFGRTITRSPLAGKIKLKLKLFPLIHERFRCVQVENQDWRDCIADYDSDDAVFYIDPPYVDAQVGAYVCTMSHSDHQDLITVIMELKGFAAVSGYSNPLYESADWDSRHEWESFVSLQPAGDIKGNNKEGIDSKRGHATEVLWIKEAH